MSSLYNRISNQSLERLGSLADNLFAVAMTLLILGIRVPPVETIHSERDLFRAVLALGPQLLMYAMSFLTLGIFWTGHQTQLSYFSHSDRDLAWIHIVFLAAVTFIPFSTTLLAVYITHRLALLIYWLNIVVLGTTMYWSLAHGRRAGLLLPDASSEIVAALGTRVVRAQIFCTVGAVLCIFSTYWSIGFIFAVQLSYATAPKWKFFNWMG